MVQYLNEHSFRRQLQAASFLQRKKEDLNEFSERDEGISSGEDVKQHFDKVGLMNKFQKAVNDMITHMITKVAEEPQGSQCSKQLHEEKAVPPPKAVCKNVHKVACDTCQLILQTIVCAPGAVMHQNIPSTHWG